MYKIFKITAILLFFFMQNSYASQKLSYDSAAQHMNAHLLMQKLQDNQAAKKNVEDVLELRKKYHTSIVHQLDKVKSVSAKYVDVDAVISTSQKTPRPYFNPYQQDLCDKISQANMVVDVLQNSTLQNQWQIFHDMKEKNFFNAVFITSSGLFAQCAFPCVIDASVKGPDSFISFLQKKIKTNKILLKSRSKQKEIIDVTKKVNDSQFFIDRQLSDLHTLKLQEKAIALKIIETKLGNHFAQWRNILQERKALHVREQQKQLAEKIAMRAQKLQEKKALQVREKQKQLAEQVSMQVEELRTKNAEKYAQEQLVALRKKALRKKSKSKVEQEQQLKTQQELQDSQSSEIDEYLETQILENKTKAVDISCLTPYQKFCLEKQQKAKQRELIKQQLFLNKKLDLSQRKKLLDRYDHDQPETSIALLLQVYSQMLYALALHEVSATNKKNVEEAALKLPSIIRKLVSVNECLYSENQKLCWYVPLECYQKINEFYKKFNDAVSGQNLESVIQFLHVRQIQLDGLNSDIVELQQLLSKATQEKNKEAMRVHILEIRQKETQVQTLTKVCQQHKALESLLYLHGHIKMLHDVGSILNPAYLFCDVVDDLAFEPAYKETFVVLQNQLQDIKKTEFAQQIGGCEKVIYISEEQYHAIQLELRLLFEKIGLEPIDCQMLPELYLRSARMLSAAYKGNLINIDSLEFDICQKFKKGPDEKDSYSPFQIILMAKIQTKLVKFFAQILYEKEDCSR